VEVLYRDDFEVDALVPAVLSSVVAYSTFTMVFGEGAMFSVVSEFPFDPRQLPLYLAMATACAIVGVFFVWLFDEVDRVFGKLQIWPPLRVTLGGLMVGVLALVMPLLWESVGLVDSSEPLLGTAVLGVGYGWLQEVLLPTGMLVGGAKGIDLLLTMALVKVLATCLSNGSGGAGGIFGPSVVIGGFVGGAFGVAFHDWFPNVVPEPSAFCIVGMAAFVGGVTHSPISTLVMASEMTGNYELLVPIMLAEVVTVALMRRWRHYSCQVTTRRQSPAHVEDYALAALERLTVADAAKLAEVRSVPAAMPLGDLLRVASELESSIVCVEADGKLVGIVNLESLRSVFNEDLGPLAIALDCAAPLTTLQLSDTLSYALEQLTESHLPQLPVRSERDPSRLIGLLHLQDVLDTYSREVQGSTPDSEVPLPSSIGFW
jgi:CIC family chloride channel protein